MLAIAGVLCSLLVSSCSNAGQPPVGETDEDAASRPVPYQEQVLAGGVTFDEYKRSTLAAMHCIEAEGIKVYGPFEENGGRGLSFDYGGLPFGASEEALLAQEAVADACIDTYLSEVATAYAESVAPTEAEIQVREANRRQCARDLGYHAPESMLPGQLYVLIFEHEELGVCLDRFP